MFYELPHYLCRCSIQTNQNAISQKFYVLATGGIGLQANILMLNIGTEFHW